jgi:hypothetical protein
MICRSFPNVRFVKNNFEGFGQQKNLAVMIAKNEWILNVDADEFVTPELRYEIFAKLRDGKRYEGYKIRRNNLWFGKFFLDGYPGALRLFRKSCGIFNYRYVHEKVQIRGDIGQIHSVLTHKPASHKDFSSHFKIYSIKYGKLAAKDYRKRGIRLNFSNFWWRLGGVPLLIFFREYFVKNKFKLGKAGLYISICSALNYYIAALELIEIQDR